MEHCENLALSRFRRGHKGLDTTIRRAWLGQHSSTAEMLEHIESFLNAQSERIGRSVPEKISKNR